MTVETQEPFAWCWYVERDERYEFVLRQEDAPAEAFPLYKQPQAPTWFQPHAPTCGCTDCT